MSVDRYLTEVKSFLAFLGAFLLFFSDLSLNAQSAQTKVQLVSSVDQFEPGKPFIIGVHLQMPVGWHTYWINPGDSGIPTEVKWNLPEGFSASPLQWPVPVRIEAPPLVTFGYEKEVVLFATITPAENFKKGASAKIEAEVRWLECKESCIPGKATERISLLSGKVPVEQRNPEAVDLLKRFQLEIPTQTMEGATAVFPDKSFLMTLKRAESKSVIFFPLTEGKVALAKKFTVEMKSNQTEIRGEFEEIPSILNGLLVTEGLKGRELFVFESSVIAQSVQEKSSSAKQSLIAILFFAFVGGLLLNLMPCVLPVLSLKILGFVNEAQQEGSKVWKHGVAFTAGVMISFWLLTGILLALRLGGEGLGWGFQLQSPSFVLAMTLFFLAMTLNLFGVFEVGSSLVSLQNQVTEKKGLGKSFGSGVLATVVATPCSAPFMGVAVGYALSQSVGLTFLVMSFLGFGVAAPYLLLSLKPNWIRKIPKPGEWMIGFKQFLGFLMMGTVLWLIWVYAQLQGIMGLGSILMAVGLISFGLWWWGRSGSLMSKGMAVFFVFGAIFLSLPQSQKFEVEKYSATRVEELHQRGQPVFIDFTAAWCLTCQVNKKLVLHQQEIQEAFRLKGVIVMEADWTNSDPEITKALERWGRASVPLYLLYGRDPKADPILLPEILTKEIVLKALKGI